MMIPPRIMGIGNAGRYTDNASEDIEFAQKGIEIVQSA